MDKATDGCSDTHERMIMAMQVELTTHQIALLLNCINAGQLANVVNEKSATELNQLLTACDNAPQVEPISGSANISPVVEYFDPYDL